MNDFKLVELMGDIYRKLLKDISPMAKAEGLSMTEMLVLWKMEMRQCRRVGELADDLGLYPSTLTGILDRLTAAGWLEREDDPDDRRAVVMRRTEKLARFLHLIRRESGKRLESVFKKMPRELTERLGADLTAVYERFEAEENQE